MKKSLMFCQLILFSGIFAALFAQGPSGVVVDILQINDVYEISPLENGKTGGMARVATLRNKMLAANPNTYSVLPGDFLSPSAMGLTKVDGKRLAGKQMVDILNRLGFDLVTFGNHEFDLDSLSLVTRINESHFRWISSNCFRMVSKEDAQWVPFTQRVDGFDIPVAPWHIEEFYGNSSGSFKVGFFAVTVPSTMPPYCHITDPLAAARNTYSELKDKCDAVVAITHQSIEDDVLLAKALPDLAFIMGAHEHSRSETKVGNVTIYKPDANAKSAWVHHLVWDPALKKLVHDHRLEFINSSVAEDPVLDVSVSNWNRMVFEAMKKEGFDPEQVIATLTDTLDGRELSNRNGPTNLGILIATAMAKAWPDADCGLLNSGSIRIDDEVMGSVTQYDIFRILPFGGSISHVNMRGDLLIKTLDLGTSDALYGNGGFLQMYNVSKGKKGWLIGGKPIRPTQFYVVAGTDYWITRETKYLQLWTDYKDLFTVTSGTTPEQKDIRKALITHLVSLKP